MTDLDKILNEYFAEPAMSDDSTEPQIVRCRECTWFDVNECMHSLGLVGAFDHCFCSYGERRTDE